MNLENILVGMLSLLFFTLGIDKFLHFMKPPCTLMGNIDPMVWKLLGVTTIIGGVLIWIPKLRKSVALFFIIYMLGFSIIHLISKTYDMGGALFTAGLLSLVVWSPSFLKSKKSKI